MILGSDTSDELKAWAFLLVAVALLVLVIAVGWRIKKLSVDVRGVKVSLATDVVPAAKKIDQIHTDTAGIAIATNHTPPGELPMVHRIRNLEKGQENILKALDTHRKETKEWQNTIVSKLGIEVTRAQSHPTKEGE